MSDSDCPLAVLLIGEKNGCDEDCVRETCECFANMAEGCRLTQQDMQTVGSEGVGHARVIIVPGGDVWPDSDDEEDHLAQLAALGPEGSEVLSRAVRDDGAVYLGVCAGAFLAVELEEFGLQDKVRIVHRDAFGFQSNGPVRGYVTVKATPEATLAVPGMVESMQAVVDHRVWFEDGPLLECIESADVHIILTYDGPCDREYAGLSKAKRAKMKSQWLNDGPKMHGKVAAVVCRVGRGAVVLISPHPELSEGCHETLPRVAAAAMEWAASGVAEEVPPHHSMCALCGGIKGNGEFAKSQLKKPVAFRRCKTCVAQL